MSEDLVKPIDKVWNTFILFLLSEEELTLGLMCWYVLNIIMLNVYCLIVWLSNLCVRVATGRELGDTFVASDHHRAPFTF